MMTTEPKNTELMPCPFCGQQDAFVEQLDIDASVVICQGLVGEHAACLARGPVGLREHEVEEQPGRSAAVREWNKRAQTADVQCDPVHIEAVAVTREDEDGQLYLDWLVEGGICALEFAGQVLLVADSDITDDEGSGEVHRQAPPAPVEPTTCAESQVGSTPTDQQCEPVALPADWRSLADQLQAVGLAYWDAHHRERGPGAVKWLHNEETGALFVISRGEYASEVKDFVCSLDGKTQPATAKGGEVLGERLGAETLPKIHIPEWLASDCPHTVLDFLAPGGCSKCRAEKQDQTGSGQP